MGGTFAYYPGKILWVNMITAVTLSLTLAFEPPERNIMAACPGSLRAITHGVYDLAHWFVSLIMLTILRPVSLGEIIGTLD